MKKSVIIYSFVIVMFIGVTVYVANKQSTKSKQKDKLLHNITLENKIRGCDGWGCGDYEASREDRLHHGIDILVSPGEKVFSPINGKMIRISYPYSDTKWKGVLITNDFYEIKMWYFIPIIKPYQEIKKGQLIGYAQDISEKYSNTMKPHVHIEVKELGEYIDPTNLFE